MPPGTGKAISVPFRRLSIEARFMNKEVMQKIDFENIVLATRKNMNPDSLSILPFFK